MPAQRPCPPARQRPRWRLRRQLAAHAPTPGLRGWLLEGGSLTRRLRAACDGQLRVEVLGQRLARPLPEELEALGLRRPGYVWLREVALHCAGRPWVYARTLLPLDARRGATRGLTRLGSRPLGEVLFVDPRVRRGRREVAQVRPGEALHAAAARVAPGAGVLWARRAVYWVRDQRLLVCEIFVPAADARAPIALE